MPFLDRSRDRDVRHLEWRVRTFGAGALLGVIAMALDISWLIWVAIGVLLCGYLLRFLPAEGDETDG